MALRNRRGRDDVAAARRYQMKTKLLSIGDDYWIEDEAGQRTFKVDGKAMRIRDTFVIENAAGDEVAKIKERKLSVRDSMKIEHDGREATVHKKLIGLRERFKIDVDGGPDLEAHGNLVDHEYEIERDGDTVATVSKRWFSVRDTYGIEIAPGTDEVLIVAVTVCVDAMTHD